MDEKISIGEANVASEPVVDLVKKSRFFSDLNPGEMEILAEWISAYSFPTGTFILKEGNQENCLCILVEGAIDIYKYAEPDKHLKIASIKPGETIGEMGVVDGQPFSASAIATVNSVVMMITRDDFDRLTDKHETLGVKLLRKISVTISSRLRNTTGRLADMMAIK
jgi:CRP-like cAMP-binding protein